VSNRAALHRSGWAALLLPAAFALLSGCMVNEERPVVPIAAQKATAETPQDELLDVGVRLFDPNFPADEKEQAKREIYPDVRKAESRYMPTLLRDTLEGTGHWGQVRVLPRDGSGMDVLVDGRIVESTGRDLVLDLKATDATGRVLLQKTYSGQADLRAYKDVPSKPRDPFDNVYNSFANDLLAVRNKLTHDQKVAVHQVNNLRFAADLAPYAFAPYLAKDKQGLYQVARLPATDDPIVQKMDRIRERDYSLIDTLNEHYTNFGDSMHDAYINWRKYSHEEIEQVEEAKRKALTREVLGAAAVVAGVVADSKWHGQSSVESAATTAAIIGGIYAFKSGLDMRSEIKMHTESLKQLDQSFQNEVQPIVVDIEGRTLQLKGSAEDQYAEWRQLLKELYENETGLPATTAATGGAAAAAGKP
jgi:hypothetical protein